MPKNMINAHPEEDIKFVYIKKATVKGCFFILLNSR